MHIMYYKFSSNNTIMTITSERPHLYSKCCYVIQLQGKYSHIRDFQSIFWLLVHWNHCVMTHNTNVSTCGFYLLMQSGLETKICPGCFWHLWLNYRSGKSYMGQTCPRVCNTGLYYVLYVPNFTRFRFTYHIIGF